MAHPLFCFFFSVVKRQKIRIGKAYGPRQTNARRAAASADAFHATHHTTHSYPHSPCH